MSIIEKDVIAFDFDGTLNESKVPIDEEMGELLCALLQKKMVAIISGSGYDYFKLNILDVFKCSPELFKKLYLFPTSGARFWQFDESWREVYSEEMTLEERKKIKDAFEKAFKDIDYHHPAQLFGEVVEDRGTQITFSALGQQAPIDLKRQWKETQDRRLEIVTALQKYLPEFEIKVPGVTSIDVTRKGIDKAYGIKKIESITGVPVSRMIFVGDALYEGGNDHPVIKTGIDTVAVANPAETKILLRKWLAELV